MLDEDEYSQVMRPWTTRSFDRSLGLKKGMEKAVLDEYERITGFRETNMNAVAHHRISLHGPPCTRCGKPLRSPRATFCAACGHVPGDEREPEAASPKMNKAGVERLVAEELAKMPEAARSSVQARLTEATPEQRTFAYGPGHFWCWRVGFSASGERAVVYQGNPGAFSERWGCVEIDSQDLGTDACWFESLYDAAIASGWLSPPAGYEAG